MDSTLTIQASAYNALQKTYCVLSMLYLVLLAVLPWYLAAVLKPLPLLCLLIYLTGKPKKLRFGSRPSDTACCPTTFSILGGQAVTKLLFLTLSFGMLGDIMLALPGSNAFMCGMMCFIAMHCGYCIQLIPHFRWQKTRTALMLLICGISLLGYMILRASMGDFAIPALVYLGFLLTMVFFALHTRANNKYLLIGGILFWLSDSFLGFNEFMTHSTWLTLLVMTMYYLSQWHLFMGISHLQKT